MSLDWGSVPDWLAGVGTIGALIFAYRAVRAANRQNQHQAAQLARLENDQRDRDEEQRRAQASNVALWWQHRDRSASGPAHAFYVSNTSDLPVTEVVFVVRTPRSQVECLAVPYIAPRTREVNSIDFDKVFSQLRDEFVEFQGHGPSGDMAALEFTDMAGLRWRRNLSGNLTPIDREQRHT